MANNEWNRDEYIVVLDLYLNRDIVEDSSDPQVRDVAELIDRSPGAVGLRLANYRHVDPDSTEGMSHVSKACREIWEEYVGNEGELAYEADLARSRLEEKHQGASSTMVETGERRSETTSRRGQADFRSILRDRYNDSCLLCDVSRPGLLQAGHILDWSENDAHRGDPENGLLLCYTHHRAFDIGLFTITEDYNLAVNPELDEATGFLKKTLVNRHGDSLDFYGNPPGKGFLRNRNTGLMWYNA